MRQFLLFFIALHCHFLSFGDETTLDFNERFQGCPTHFSDRPSPSSQKQDLLVTAEQRLLLQQCIAFPEEQVSRFKLPRHPVELYKAYRNAREQAQNEQARQKYLDSLESCESAFSPADRERWRTARRAAVQKALVAGSTARLLKEESEKYEGVPRRIPAQWSGNYNACARLVNDEYQALQKIIYPNRPEPPIRFIGIGFNSYQSKPRRLL